MSALAWTISCATWAELRPSCTQACPSAEASIGKRGEVAEILFTDRMCISLPNDAAIVSATSALVSGGISSPASTPKLLSGESNSKEENVDDSTPDSAAQPGAAWAAR